jgi:hypothetical protein
MSPTLSFFMSGFWKAPIQFSISIFATRLTFSSSDPSVSYGGKRSTGFLVRIGSSHLNDLPNAMNEQGDDSATWQRPGLFLALLVIALSLLWLLSKPMWVGSPRLSKISVIINNLRQIDGAKQQWAIERNLTGGVAVTREDLSNYLGLGDHLGWIKPVAGERYILNVLTQAPEAELTREVEGKPKGTRIHLQP